MKPILLTTSPLWAQKKLVHFLSIWGPIILSHGHINSATEKARAWQHSQTHGSQCLVLFSRKAGFCQMQDGRTVCPLGALPRGEDILFSASYFLFRIQFSPVGKDEKFWLPVSLLKQWNPHARRQVSCSCELWLEAGGLAEVLLSKGKVVTLVNSEPHPHMLPAGLPGASCL